MSVSQEQMIKAFRKGRMDVIDSLLQSGLDVNAPINRLPPLHRACLGETPYVLDVVTKLLAHGANVDLGDDFGWNALSSTLSTDAFQPHVAQLILDCSKKGINRLDHENNNYLWVAWSIESIRFLVENGIDINHVTNNQENDVTYLDLAPLNEIEYLRSVGAKLYSEL